MSKQLEREFYGHAINSTERAVSELMSYNDTYFLDASAGDAVPPDTTGTPSLGTDYWKNCRCISCDVTGICKIDYLNERGEVITEVLTLTGGSQPRPVRNVIKLYQNYAAATASTVKSYNSSGVLVTGAIKLHR